MGMVQHMGKPSGLPLSLLSQAIHRLTRAELEDFAQSLIDHMDGLDGDPDFEEDDPHGQSDEDGINTGNAVFCLHGTAIEGPGCPISDDDFGEPGSRPRYGEDQTELPLNAWGKP